MEAATPETGVAEGYEALASGDWNAARLAFESALYAADETPDAGPSDRPCLLGRPRLAGFSCGCRRHR